ncbi:phosphohistidine phosphatase SixA [soil metagenome]
MKLYFLRHGKSDWPNWDKPDDERPLTKKGKKEMCHVARLLCKLKITPAMLTSPLPRARQTAEIVADCLCLELREEKSLGQGFTAAKLRQILKSNEVDELMLVGHEPDFSAVIRSLTGANIKLSKAGVARVDLEQGTQAGCLIWLLPPKLAKR